MNNESTTNNAPQMDFTTFVLSLAGSAQVHLGLIEDPVSKEKKVSLPLAKQTIDMLSMIQEKTKGNLSEHEGKVMEHVMFELRMQFVEAQKK